MTHSIEPQVNWTPEVMVEVMLNEPDDFLKVRETLTRIGVASRKEKNFINLVIFYISKVGITSHILRRYMEW